MRNAILAAAGLAVAALVASGCREEPRLDAAITADVEREFAEEKIPGSIGVSTINGVVTLTGNVPNAEARDDAEDVAEDIDGVKQVMNNLRTTAAGDAPAAVDRPTDADMAPPAADRPAGAPPPVDPNAPSAPDVR